MKKIIYILTLVACIVIINGLARSIYDLWNKQDLVVKAESDLEKEKRENEQLKKELAKVKSSEFIESEARNKLFLVKPGESGVIIPSNLILTPSPKPKPQLPNWQKWIKLLGF